MADRDTATAGDAPTPAGEGGRDGAVDPFDPLRQFLALESDVLVLSVAMFAFSLGFQMTGRYMSEYLVVLGATPFVVGLYGSVGNVISAVYSYPGGVISDRIGSRYALTLFGLLSTLGFLVWLVASLFEPVTLGTISLPGFVLGPLALDPYDGPVVLEPWLWIFLGLFLAQAWKSFGLGATFAVVKQSVAPEHLARGFASTETFRRIAFLLGPVGAAAALFLAGGEILPGFLYVLALAAVAGAVATVAQHVLYDASADTLGSSFGGLAQLRADLRALPDPLRPLLVGDTLVRFANGMVYGFVVLVVTRVLAVSTTVAGVTLSPPVLFGVLLGLEMAVALLVMVPAATVAERVGLKPVVATGFAVYAVFPVLLISVPADGLAVATGLLGGDGLDVGAPTLLALVFAFSGLRFAGLPAHKALIVGPAERDAGGRVTGAYYLLRNAVVIPSALLGGALWDFVSPEVAFTVATAVGLVGTVYFVAFGEEFGPYAAD